MPIVVKKNNIIFYYIGIAHTAPRESKCEIQAMAHYKGICPCLLNWVATQGFVQKMLIVHGR